MQSTIRGKEAAASNFALQFERVFVHLDEGVCTITTEHTIFGYSLYAATMHTVQIQNGTLKSDTLGGSFGRLRIPAKVMKPLEIVFSPVWKVLDHDRVLLSKMQAVNFHKASVEMITRPAGRH